MKKQSEVIRLVISSIDKCGGIEKWDHAHKVMMAIPPSNYCEYLDRLAKNESGARQMMMFALLGLTLASAVHHATIKGEA